MSTTCRSEFPRPDFKRTHWLSLNGTWQFSFSQSALEADLRCGRGFDQEIHVPFVYQCQKSGIFHTQHHDCVWYARCVTLQPSQLQGQVLLKFGAVDQKCWVYINGDLAGTHSGGYTQFALEIAPFLVPGENTIAVKVIDTRACHYPRGKQYWKEVPDRCWYTESTGIWKSVWLEFTGETYIQLLRCLPNLDTRSVLLDLSLNQPFTGSATISIFFQHHCCKRVTTLISGQSLHEILVLSPEDAVDEIHYWSPEHPNLYAITIELGNENGICDRVESYFGMRQIEVRESTIYLNHQPIYQRLILDQGFWPESLYTPPDEAAIIRDLELVKAMGFNGIRKHQKNEDPLFYYHADRMGLLVWLEMPSAYAFDTAEIDSMLHEWSEMIQENWNHPSIIAYVPLNESWGVRDISLNAAQQHLAACLYHVTKALDPTRLVSSNDGWEFPQETDFYGFHNYFHDIAAFSGQFADWAHRLQTGMLNRPLQIPGTTSQHRPVILSEFGGITVSSDLGSNGAWGYTSAVGAEDYQAQLRAQLQAVVQLDYLSGYCYTQLTDVMQEVNGLLRADRSPKLSLEIYRTIFSEPPLQYRK